MDQLGHLAADHGGALDELDGVRVAVTSTDGSRYEMAVGWAGGHD